MFQNNEALDKFDLKAFWDDLFSRPQPDYMRLLEEAVVGIVQDQAINKKKWKKTHFAKVLRTFDRGSPRTALNKLTRKTGGRPQRLTVADAYRFAFALDMTLSDLLFMAELRLRDELEARQLRLEPGLMLDKPW